MSRNKASEPAQQNPARPDTDELEYLRQQIDSLYAGGDYTGCAKMIEDNMKVLYEKERWPDIFFSILRTYQRCYASLGKSEQLEERMTQFLKNNGIPVVLAPLLRLSDSSITWGSGYFKNLALQSERRGDFESSLSYCDLVIKLDPSNSSAFVTRGWILDDLERYDEAIEMFEQAIKLNESNHIAINSLAKHLTDKNLNLALEYAEKAIALAPTEGSYYDTKAKILTRLGEREAAISCYDLAMSASPYSADYPYQKAELLLSDGKEIAAIALYRKALGLDDRHIPTLWRLARLFQDSQPDMALTYINTITTLDPDNKDVLLIRGLLLCKLGQEIAAVEEFKQILGVDPKCHEALGGYANLILNDNPAEAVKCYDKAIELSPKTADYHTGKARAYEKLDQIPEAIKEYRTVISLNKNDARAYARLASLLADTKPREAIDFYSRAIEIMPENAYYYAAKAEILMKQPGGVPEAIACFGKASQLDPGNAQLHSLLAKLLRESGNAAGAAEHLKKFVGLDPSDPEAFYELAKAAMPAEPEMALLHINSAISLDESNSEYYYFKAKLLNELGHNGQALKQFGESLRADGKNTEALNEISELLSSDSPQIALMYINRAIDMSPENPDYLCTRANLLFGMGQHSKALAQYEEALRHSSKNHEALFGIARCLALKADDKALEFFDKAISLEPNIAGYHAEKAAFLASRDRTGEALAAYASAIAIDGQSWKYFLEKAKLLELSGSTSEALEAYNAAVAIYPDCIEAVGKLGILLAGSSPSAALEYLDRAIEVMPQEYIYHAWKGSTLLSLGNSDAAAAEYQKAALLGRETAETYFTLANITHDRLPEIALGYCLRAIDEDASAAGYHLLCGKIYVALNQTGSAIERFKSAIELDPCCHEAREKIAGIYYSRKDAAALEAVDAALENNPDCSGCLFLKAKILDEQVEDSDIDEIIAYIDNALKLSPELVPAREMLIGLLQRKRAFVRLALEKRKLGKFSKSRR